MRTRSGAGACSRRSWAAARRLRRCSRSCAARPRTSRSRRRCCARGAGSSRRCAADIAGGAHRAVGTGDASGGGCGGGAAPARAAREGVLRMAGGVGLVRVDRPVPARSPTRPPFSSARRHPPPLLPSRRRHARRGASRAATRRPSPRTGGGSCDDGRRGRKGTFWTTRTPLRRRWETSDGRCLPLLDWLRWLHCVAEFDFELFVVFLLIFGARCK